MKWYGGYGEIMNLFLLEVAGVFVFLSLFVKISVQWYVTGDTGVREVSHGSLRTKVLIFTAFSCFLGSILLDNPPPSAELSFWKVFTVFPSFFTFYGFRYYASGFLGTLGLLGLIYSQLAMGVDWRIGVDTQEKTGLVTTGLFGVTRNPIYDFACLGILSLPLYLLSPLSLVGALLIIGAFHGQVVLSEEPYLLKLHGEKYRRYCKRVPRWILFPLLNSPLSKK